MSTKAERRAARERVSTYHREQLDQLVNHVAAAIDEYQADNIDAFDVDVDETILQYSRAAKELWKFCTLTSVEIAHASSPTSPTRIGGSAENPDDLDSSHHAPTPAGSRQVHYGTMTPMTQA